MSTNEWWIVGICIIILIALLRDSPLEEFDEEYGDTNSPGY